MGFQKGNTPKGRRAKGTPNKKTLILDSFAKTIVEGGMEKFQAELMKLKGQAFVKSFMTIFEYVKPKLARTELTGKDGDELPPINIVIKDK